MNKTIISLAIYIITYNCTAQDIPNDTTKKKINNTFSEENTTENKIDLLTKKIDSLEDKITDLKSFTKIGISLGIRGTVNHGSKSRIFAQGFISSVDSSLQIEHTVRTAMVLSAVLQTTPFKDDIGKWYKNIGFLLNINLAEISSGQTSSIFNKEVDGGLGLSYCFRDKVSIALTAEYVFSRQLKDYYIDLIEDATNNKTKLQIRKDGAIATSISKDDDTFYRNRNYFAQSIKLVFFLK